MPKCRVKNCHIIYSYPAYVLQYTWLYLKHLWSQNHVQFNCSIPQTLCIELILPLSSCMEIINKDKIQGSLFNLKGIFLPRLLFKLLQIIMNPKCFPIHRQRPPDWYHLLLKL